MRAHHTSPGGAEDQQLYDAVRVEHLGKPRSRAVRPATSRWSALSLAHHSVVEHNRVARQAARHKDEQAVATHTATSPPSPKQQTPEIERARARNIANNERRLAMLGLA